MTPQDFITKWKRSHLKERSGANEHFLDLCELLGQPTPAEADPDGAWYTFERGVNKTGGGKGWSDVWMRERFAWEYKGKHKDLPEAYKEETNGEKNRKRLPIFSTPFFFFVGGKLVATVEHYRIEGSQIVRERNSR